MATSDAENVGSDILNDKVLLGLTVSIQRSRNQSLSVFDEMARYMVDKELTTAMDGWQRQAFKLKAGETGRVIELIEDDFANFIAVLTNDRVYIDLADRTNTGFGGPPTFGEGGFGGVGLGQLKAGIKGVYIVQGRFTDLIMSNLQQETEVRVELLAIKFAEDV